MIQSIDLSDLGNTSDVDGPSFIDWLSTSTASYLLYRHTWEGDVGKEGAHLPFQAWPFFHSILSLKLQPKA